MLCFVYLTTELSANERPNVLLILCDDLVPIALCVAKAVIDNHSFPFGVE